MGPQGLGRQPDLGRGPSPGSLDVRPANLQANRAVRPGFRQPDPARLRQSLAASTHPPDPTLIKYPRTQNPFPAYVVGLASTIYESRDWPLMSILADALEELGQADLAAHCRQ